jgi:hypothetical protein
MSHTSGRRKLKTPDEVLDFTFDFTNLLTGDDTLSSFSLTTEAGITVNSSSNTTSVVTIWVSGGTLGEQYNIVCHGVTGNGRHGDVEGTIAVVRRHPVGL